jgi:hypothetical protein
MKFKTDWKSCKLSEQEKEEQNKQLLELVDKVKPYYISELKAHHELINLEAKDKFNALEMIPYNCVAKLRNKSEVDPLRQAEFVSLGTTLGSIVGGPPGAVVGGLYARAMSYFFPD